MESIIRVEHLTKEFRVFERREGIKGGLINLFKRDYRNLTAVNDVNFSISRGEIVGYIGANGAGKSTTIKMMTGILVPTSGRVVANGFVPYDQRTAYTKTIGVVFGQRTQLWWDIAVVESFNLLKKIYGISDTDFKQRLKLFSEILNISAYLHTPVRKLSLGERMRCDLAASLLHNPPVLFLDEPTIGLDVLAKANILQFLQEINREFKTTILLTTHDLADIEQLCERLVIIDKGELLFDGTLRELRRRFGGESKILFDLKEGLSQNTLDKLSNSSDAKWQCVDGMRCTVSFDPEQVTSADLIKQIVNNFDVKDIEVQEEAIEDIVRSIYQGTNERKPVNV
ncbi:MAG TPA: ATP-binding cassette domain-containing protein [Blastocatellia bacterium]|nr:ATP-binding cassette domain-containing protein [Blastocatellia bacterium]